MEEPRCTKPNTELSMMPKVLFSSNFLKERRERLGLDSYEVATMTGIKKATYRQIECRGQLPEEHFEQLAKVLRVTVEELKAEKVAVVAEALLGIPKDETHGFIARSLRQK